MLTVMQDGGWLVAGTDPVDGIADPGARSTEGDLAYTDVYHQVCKPQSFQEIGHCRGVLDLLERIRGCEILSQPQKVARLRFPRFTEHTTPTHPDFVHFQGTRENLTEDRLRVSLDSRCQRVTDPIAEHMLNPRLSSMIPLSWGKVYAGWDSAAFQYYWKRHDLTVLPKITEYLDTAFEEAVHLAERGDDRARLHLQRIAARAPDTDQGKRAEKTLSQLSAWQGQACFHRLAWGFPSTRLLWPI